jgi:demethylmenaquinone methyltransferase/2-methoxy-6-polyprenyl-1,4-benzoquinol methylase
MTELRPDAPPPEEVLPRLDLERHLQDPAIKQRFVTPMFEVIAPRYDRFTRVFSYGMDAGWKRTLLTELATGLPPSARVLDLACGTGDLALGAAAAGARVLGVDISRRMVRAAARRRRAASGGPVWFAAGHMPTLALPDASVDAVTAGYALRNAPDLGVVLDEITRVLKPGGRLLTLDFYRPRNALWRRLFLGYLRLAGNVVGWLWHRQPVAYGYIAASIEHYVSWQDFCRALEQRGFTVERVHRRMRGGICIHVARLGDMRPPNAARSGPGAPFAPGSPAGH